MNIDTVTLSRLSTFQVYISRFCFEHYINAISRYLVARLINFLKSFAQRQFTYTYTSWRVFRCNATLTFLSREEVTLVAYVTCRHTGHLTKSVVRYRNRISGQRTCVTRRTKPYPKVSRLTLGKDSSPGSYRIEAKRRTRHCTRNPKEGINEKEGKRGEGSLNQFGGIPSR